LKNYQKKSISLTLFGLFLNISIIYSQTNNDISIYNWFDKIVGKENLDIINGIPHTNPYRAINDNHLYYINQYELGNLTYEGLNYYNVKLKYDIYRDVLVISPLNESENFGVNITTYKVKSFSIKDKNFVNIDKKDSLVPQFATGYYEENKIAPNAIFYIKHHKNQQKVINDGMLSYLFKENNLYYLNLKNKIYPIKNKNNLIKSLPDQKKQINEFYLMNRELRKSDENQFMRNLMKYISNSLSIELK
jgi:hypothetical protein